MDEKSPEKAGRIRIILLKEVPHVPTLYEHSRPQLRVTRSQEPSASRPRHTRTSIAHLSSILQDQHLHTEMSTVHLTEEQPSEAKAEEKSEEKLCAQWRSDKKSNRYLSCLLESEAELEGLHAKTEGIQRLLRRRKILPIDKISQRHKNITFSLKNKRELNQDFHEFVAKKTLQPATQPQRREDESETISFSMKHYAQKRVAILRTQKKQPRQALQHMRLLEGNAAVLAPMASRKVRVQSREGGYAVAFKRISSDIPQLNCFQWSRLDQAPYHLIKG